MPPLVCAEPVPWHALDVQWGCCTNKNLGSRTLQWSRLTDGSSMVYVVALHFATIFPALWAVGGVDVPCIAQACCNESAAELKQ